VAGPRRSAEAIVIDARAAILGRIERALRTARIPSVPGVERPFQGRNREGGADRIGDPERVALQAETDGARAAAHVDTGARAFQASGSDVLERFLLEARAVGVETFVEGAADGVRERLATLVSGLRVLSWNLDRLPYGAGAVVAGATFGAAPRAEQAAADIGVTGCHGAVAETGSLVLLSAPGCSRAVSLLPPLHVALVHPEDLYPTMGDFFAANVDRMSGASSCTIVTGPSRTGDIELTLTIGVHGPGRVVVIVGPVNGGDRGNGLT
jgi:L-lactate dehydrogenase complex protein LldG